MTCKDSNPAYFQMQVMAPINSVPFVGLRHRRIWVCFRLFDT